MQRPVLLALALSAGLSAQAPTFDWMVPVHTAAADPKGGDYGLWAAGPDYKASFHDGFTFYPVVGASTPDRSVRWSTEALTVDGQPVLRRGTPRIVTDRWRVEYRYDGWTEAYDVRADGVEQTFVLQQRPNGTSDLVIAGSMTTSLRADDTAPAHRDLVFADDDGEPVVRYGAGFAFDSKGAVTPISTCHENGRVELHVPRAWLDGASYPIVVDPLTSTVPINSGTQLAIDVDVARDDESNQLMTVFTRRISADDHDAFAVLSEDDFSNPTLVWTDVNANWDTENVRIAFVSGADRWVAAFSRDFGPGGFSAVRTYLHDKGDTTLNSGTTMFLGGVMNAHQYHPSVGGTGGFNSPGTNAYLAWERRIGTSFSIHGTTVDCATGTFGPTTDLEDVAHLDSRRPCVSRQSLGADWCVVWQQFNELIVNDDWDVQGARILPNGAVLGTGWFGDGIPGDHQLQPIVAGAHGRYLIAYTVQDNTGAPPATLYGRSIATMRGDWAAGVLNKQLPRTLVESDTLTYTTAVTARGIDYDTNTESHWAVAYSDHVADSYVHRVGANGCSVEAQVLPTAFGPSVVYNDDDYRFAIAWRTVGLRFPVLGAQLNYSQDAAWTAFGTGCAGEIVCTNRGSRDLPYAGSEFFSIDLENGRPGAFYGLFVSPTRQTLPLGPGCDLLLGAPIIALKAGFTSTIDGSLRCPIPLPDCGPSRGSLYAQFVGFFRGEWLTSDGVRIDVR